MDNMYAAFCAWFKDYHGFNPSVASEDSHLVGSRRVAFEAGYKAALNSLNIKLPAKEESPPDDNNYAHGYNRAITECSDAIKSQGFTVELTLK
ncbi:hypothetical protein ABM005_04340 [Morganella morganii]|uniref:hypothetical protein n=1 Tax=Morganella morganii TaxID=582 RepID=UPI001BDAE6F6|nr:hypothetical protein [Morganella morganii]MBT0345016.1 hypothetical protein [Morganella morganii subsp. morganii]HDT0711983.1 hypothetical protein [Morganella morganii subsp. morganii]